MSKSIYILEPIFEWGFNDKILSEQLSKIEQGEPITVFINSPGGSVFTGYSVYNLLLEKSKTNEITIKIIGLAASIASLIAFAGHKTLIAKTASYLIHNPYSIAIGDAEEFKKQGKVLDDITNQIIDVYKRKTNLDNDGLKSIMNEDRLMTSKEALKYKLVDAIYEPDKEEEEELKATNYMDKIESYKYVALSNREKILINHQGEESMPIDKDSGAELSKLLNEKIDQVAELKSALNQKEVEIGTIKNEYSAKISDLEKVNSEVTTQNSTLSKEIKELKGQIATIEVSNLVSGFINSGKILPAMKDYEVQDLLDKKINNVEAFNKKVEILNSLPTNPLLANSYNRTTETPNITTIQDFENPDNDAVVTAMVKEFMVKNNVDFETAFNTLRGGLNG